MTNREDYITINYKDYNKHALAKIIEKVGVGGVPLHVTADDLYDIVYSEDETMQEVVVKPSLELYHSLKGMNL